MLKTRTRFASQLLVAWAWCILVLLNGCTPSSDNYSIPLPPENEGMEYSQDQNPSEIED